jgi:hypothetical protein
MLIFASKCRPWVVGGGAGSDPKSLEGDPAPFLPEAAQKLLLLVYPYPIKSIVRKREAA